MNRLDKALYRASLWYAKHRGNIVNAALVGKLMALIGKLKETKGMRIFKRGFKKAAEMLRKCEEHGQEQGVFTWAPQLKHWLKDHELYLLARNGAVKKQRTEKDIVPNLN